MERTKFTRLCALFLALLFLIPGGVISVAAAGVTSGTGSSSVTDKTIDDVREQLSAISYEEYTEKYAHVKRAAKAVEIKGVDYDKAATGAQVKIDTYDGAEALYLPDTGIVSWKVSIPETAKYSVLIIYYPIEAKSTSVQRIFRIDGTIPFSESRYITMPKVWKNRYNDGEFKLGKKDSAAEYLAAAAAAGISATSEEREDGTYIVYKMPEYWTQAASELVDSKLIRFFKTDIDENELRNSMVQSPVWCSFELKDIDGFYSESFEFVFTAGEREISLEGVNEPVAIKSILLIPHEDLVSYEEYISRYANESKGGSVVKLEGEYPSATSTQTVYPVEDRACAVNSPSDTTRTVLNTIGGDKWQTPGQALEYSFCVGESGMYQIVPRFRQNILDGIYTSRVLYIYSGEGVKSGDKGYYSGIPFKEATEFVFNYSTDWQSGALMYPVTDENAKGEETTEYREVEFYFEAGVTYTIRLEVALGSMGDVVRQIGESLKAINDDYLSILKLTGATPDKYRDYGFYRIMPDVLIDMNVQANTLAEISKKLAATSGVKSTSSSILDKVVVLLRRMKGSEDEVARNLDLLKSYLGTLGTLLSDSKTQPLQLDYIMIQSSEAKLPKAKPNFFESFLHEMSSFFMSFIRNYNRLGAMTEDSESQDSVEVWMASGRDQAQVVRNLINNDFTPNSSYPINLKLVAGSTLLPSILSGSGPDVYIGLGEDNVINYAIRGALLGIENFDGFYDMALNKDTRQFNDAAMLVLGIDDADGNYHYYGLPESQNFPMMFIRTDILADLDIDIPKTWDDLLEAVPILQANNMEIGLTSQQPPDYRIFLYQMGGTLFADGGMRINLDSNTALESFEMMCNMYTMYSFPYKYDFANRFRTGEMPIGIASYIGTYNQLVVYATEIRGLWQFVPLPGIEDENGNINNVSVSTVSAIVMINGCENQAGAWEFMKWHAGEQCQSDYANEMVAILGDSAKHSTANLNALEKLPWTSEERANVEKQFGMLASIPNYPGSYIIGRYTKFAFLDALNYNKDPVDGVLKYIATINKEITKKRKEFDLETLDLGDTKAIKRMRQTAEVLDDIAASSSYSPAYDSLIGSARQAMESNEAAAMILVSEQLRAVYRQLDPTGAIAAGEIEAIKKKENCFAYEAYEYAKELATQFYYAAEFLGDAGEALNADVD